MPALMPTDFTATITWLGRVGDRAATLRSAPLDEVFAGFAGVDGEEHAGLTRPSCSRVTAQHPRGTTIRNVRQFSIVSAEDLAAVAGKMGLAAIEPAWIGASVVIDGIPDFTLVPPSSRLQGPDGVTLVIDMENRPCHLPAKVIDEDAPGQGHAFKTAAKERLANWLGERTGFTPDPQTLFDVQAKRIHEYKRQHLNLLHIVWLYEQIKQNPNIELTPRTFIFGGKAAPGYFLAKLIIKLVNAVGAVVNNDPQVHGYLRVIFMPDFNVKNGQRLYPAADLSEQISLAGKEASGTGNMKFGMNGALTIGTLDGANVEIRDEVGHDNFFLFGMTAPEVQQCQADGYRPWELYHANDELKSAVDLISSGLFSHGDTELFRPLTDNLIHSDPFMVLADFRAYVDCQRGIDRAYRAAHHWDRMSILNTARMGKFSSDRSIQDYVDQIWKTPPMPIEV